MMRVLDIIYGGGTYHVNDRTLDQLKDEIAQADGGRQIWIEVIDGGGPAHLLIGPGVPIAIIPSRGDDT